eukprot:CAMPEP_0201587178 /NCGR_PEP_ID=MMETSP0190_2-20130828/141150_1 /ASSEMBLY_ACC=CAM_ASM_000263 /TAXON_ID=37353 /ORGANISM="Rosalina sp." /LENGTH=30 /DNA_ID= /DNA_START= /DNA_END= /DNA_ORIENTATION=
MQPRVGIYNRQATREDDSDDEDVEEEPGRM